MYEKSGRRRNGFVKPTKSVFIVRGESGRAVVVDSCRQISNRPQQLYRELSTRKSAFQRMKKKRSVFVSLFVAAILLAVGVCFLYVGLNNADTALRIKEAVLLRMR